MSDQIFKLQRPISSSEDMPMVLVYNETREYEQMIPMIDEDIEGVFGDELKVYVSGFVDETDGILHIKEYVEEQDW